VQAAELEALLEEARTDRGVYFTKCDEMKTKQKAKRKDWADERKRLLRCLEAQTRHNTIHLQVSLADHLESGRLTWLVPC
jgi:hypothetical protein